MLLTVQIPRPPEAPNLVSDVPFEWPELWLQILSARSGAKTQPLRQNLKGDWTLDGQVCARTAALFDVYKPLLDARARQHRHFVATATGDSYYVTT